MFAKNIGRRHRKHSASVLNYAFLVISTQSENHLQAAKMQLAHTWLGSPNEVTRKWKHSFKTYSNPCFHLPISLSLQRINRVG
jgi:hypothetical protein